MTLLPRGLMLVLSSPSGAGKTTVARRLLATEPELVLSVSATTRPPRPGEQNGGDYRFVDRDTFAAMVARDEFLEHARVFGHDYGTPRAGVEGLLATGRDVLFDIDWQGKQQLRQRAGDDLVSIFLLPPSMTVLKERLRARAQDADDVVQARMSHAADEMSHWDDYDYVLVNESLGRTVADVRAVLHAERLRARRMPDLAAFVRGLGRAGS